MYSWLFFSSASFFHSWQAASYTLLSFFFAASPPSCIMAYPVTSNASCVSSQNLWINKWINCRFDLRPMCKLLFFFFTTVWWGGYWWRCYNFFVEKLYIVDYKKEKSIKNNRMNCFFAKRRKKWRTDGFMDFSSCYFRSHYTLNFFRHVYRLNCKFFFPGNKLI